MGKYILPFSGGGWNLTFYKKAGLTLTVGPATLLRKKWGLGRARNQGDLFQSISGGEKFFGTQGGRNYPEDQTKLPITPLGGLRCIRPMSNSVEERGKGHIGIDRRGGYNKLWFGGEKR